MTKILSSVARTTSRELARFIEVNVALERARRKGERRGVEADALSRYVAGANGGGSGR